MSLRIALWIHRVLNPQKYTTPEGYRIAFDIQLSVTDSSHDPLNIRHRKRKLFVQPMMIGSRLAEPHQDVNSTRRDSMSIGKFAERTPVSLKHDQDCTGAASAEPIQAPCMQQRPRTHTSISKGNSFARVQIPCCVVTDYSINMSSWVLLMRWWSASGEVANGGRNS
jgi:hypothetical protein